MDQHGSPFFKVRYCSSDYVTYRCTSASVNNQRSSINFKFDESIINRGVDLRLAQG
ncbi:hypothetical protein D3C80_1935330 [compost metagenome]